MAPLRCEKVRERLSAYIDGELGSKERSAVGSHLLACPSCSAEVEELRVTRALIRSLPQTDLPSSFHSTLVARVKEEATARGGSGGTLVAAGQAVSRFLEGLRKWRFRWVVVSACLAVFLLWAGSFAFYLGIVPEGLVSLNRSDRDAGPASQEDRAGEGEALLYKMETPSGDASFGSSGGAKDQSLDIAASPGTSPGLASAVRIQPASGRKVILTVSMTLQCSKLGEARDRAVTAVEAAGGFVESLSYWTDAAGMDAASLTVRVPSERLSTVLVSLRSLGKVTHEEASRVDVTAQHIDTTARIENLREQEQSILALLGRAETLADVFAIQSELTRVRTEIEIYEATLRSLEEQISYSTINISLVPGTVGPSPVASIWQRIAEAFVKSLRWMAVAVERLVVFLAGLLPVAVVMTLIALGIVAAVKSRRRRMGM